MEIESRYPPNTLRLPFACDDPTCQCDTRLGGREVEAFPLVADPVQRNGLWDVALLLENGDLHDVIHGAEDLNEALATVHREYPTAKFNPERGPRVETDQTH